jgi:DNA-binding NarL/FixJ family response regulator
MSGPMRILMVDDHPVVLAGLKALLGDDPDFLIVGETGDGRTALRLALELAPDIVVLDISLPEIHGIELATALRAQLPGARLLVLTIHEERVYVRQLLELGVHGYLLKRSASDELPRALRAVAGGGLYLDPSVAGKAVDAPVVSANPVAAIQIAKLSQREAYVLRLIASGYSNKEISSRLSISTSAVRAYKVRAMEKLGLSSLVEVVRYAAQQEWLREPMVGNGGALRV